MEEALKSLKIGPKVLVRRANTVWDNLLATKQEARQLARSVFDSQVSPTLNGVHGHPKDKDYGTWGTCGH